MSYRNSAKWSTQTWPLILSIVFAVGILFILISPRWMVGDSRKAKDSTLKANLQILRNAIEIYKEDTGKYPSDLKDLYQRPSKIPAKLWTGPYVKAEGVVILNPDIPLPANPFLAYGETETDVTKHWSYNPVTGTITPNPTTNGGKDSEGQPYSNY